MAPSTRKNNPTTSSSTPARGTGDGGGSPGVLPKAGPGLRNPAGGLNPLPELGVLDGHPKVKVVLSLIWDLNLRQKL